MQRKAKRKPSKAKLILLVINAHPEGLIHPLFLKHGLVTWQREPLHFPLKTKAKTIPSGPTPIKGYSGRAANPLRVSTNILRVQAARKKMTRQGKAKHRHATQNQAKAKQSKTEQGKSKQSNGR